MLRRILDVTSKTAIVLVASSVFIAAHAATPRLSAAELALCADNNPWIKSGYCERNDAWNLSRCLCPHENASGVGQTNLVSTKPTGNEPPGKENCDTKGSMVLNKPAAAVDRLLSVLHH